MGIDEAWAEAEAALPEGHVIAGLEQSMEGEWFASSDNFADTNRVQWAASAASPAAALRALAALLRGQAPK